MKKAMPSVVIGIALLIGGIAIAETPRVNINPKVHPNLASAQESIVHAYEKIVAAQAANDWDLQGHAQKAKDLLEQADKELRAAATAANERK